MLIIQNIVAIGDCGEYTEKKPGEPFLNPKDNPVPRIIDHLHLLAEKTQKIHEEKLKNMDETHTLITRLILNEFSLYTKDQPLSIVQYIEVINAIASLAKILPPNIHMVIATLPVLWPDKVLHNVGLHVQSPQKEGANPVLHPLNKRLPSKKELNYLDENQHYYPLYNASDNDDSNMVLSNTPVAIKDIKQYGNTIKVEIPTGENFLVTTEFCLDHKKRKGIADTKAVMKQLRRADQSCPELGSHVISSYSIQVEKTNLIASVIQADPSYLPDTAETEDIPSPCFGKKWTLFTCPVQLVQRIEMDNVKYPPPPPILKEDLNNFLFQFGQTLGEKEESASPLSRPRHHNGVA